jgi:hypothetical protein
MGLWIYTYNMDLRDGYIILVIWDIIDLYYKYIYQHMYCKLCVCQNMCQIELSEKMTK